jgi:DNA polymerase III epsilon subunit-like protein
VVDGRLLDTFSTLVNPGRPIQPFVAALTGITDAMVASAPPIAEALPRFLKFAGDAVLVAHNATFDVTHLDAAHRAITGRALARPALCTIRLCAPVAAGAAASLARRRRRAARARLLRPPPRPRRCPHRGGDPVRVPRSGPPSAASRA